MNTGQDLEQTLRAEIDDLRLRLDESEETLRAIRSGEVEALIIDGQVYTLESADAESNRFRGDVLAQINDLVIAVDMERRLTYINPAAEKQYGVRASSVLGQTIDRLFQTRFEDEDGHAEAVEAVNRDGFWRGEVVHLRPDGCEFPVEVISSLLKDNEDKPVGYLAVIRDTSERKRAEMLLHEAHEQLEQRVIDRTQDLAESNAALKSEMEIRAAIEHQRTELLQRIVTTQEDERRRIARDIHDQLGQRVTALRLQIASLNEHSKEVPQITGQTELLNRTALRLDSEISFLAWELRPASLDDLGLPEAARAFLEEWSHNYKISSDFSLRGFAGKRLRPEAETHLYRIMQEALNNIAKHADASRVNVLLEWTGPTVALIVEDNGKGIDPAKAGTNGAAKGLGLLGMSERATLLGGTVEIESSIGQGTTIYARVPAMAPADVTS